MHSGYRDGHGCLGFIMRIYHLARVMLTFAHWYWCLLYSFLLYLCSSSPYSHGCTRPWLHYAVTREFFASCDRKDSIPSDGLMCLLFNICVHWCLEFSLWYMFIHFIYHLACLDSLWTHGHVVVNTSVLYFHIVMVSKSYCIMNSHIV